MVKPNKKYIRKVVITAVLILVAYIPALLWWTYQISLPSFLKYTRSLIYMSLFAAWGASVRHRIVQIQVRRYLTGIATLMVFWILLRSIKYYFVSDLDIIRQLWYSYYIPLLLIPTLGVLVALSLGKPEDYRLPKWTSTVLIPAAILVFLVLTNDWHQLVFAFPDGEVWTDNSYTYQAVYWLTFAWTLLTAFSSLAIFISKCRVPYSRKILWLPFIPLTVCILYAVLYIVDWPVLNLIAKDMTIAFCVLFVTVLESCIWCGLIQSNSKYDELFKVSTIGARIIDDISNAVLTSEGAVPLEKEDIARVLTAPVLLSDGIRLSSAPIRGGHVVWQEDVSDILGIIAELKEADEDLKGKNAILAEEYKTRHKRQALVEKNRLYNNIQSQTHHQIQRLAKLTTYLARSDMPEEVRMYVSYITILLAYIKRRNNLIFIAEEFDKVPASELEYCMKESISNLKLAGVVCHLRMGLTAPLSYTQLVFLYDRFEAVVEATIDTLQALYATVSMENRKPVMNLNILCGEDLTPLVDEWLSVVRESENEWVLTCTAPEGGAS